jgi:hypothetical protein
LKLQKLIVVSAITLVLAGQFSTLTAKNSIDQRLIDEAMPMVEKTTDSFLVQAPYINNLVVMNVRVFNQQGEQVLYVRSRGEAVELFADDLPDGKYSYQVNTVFGLDEPIGEGADAQEAGISRESDSFIIRDGKLIEPENRSVSMNQSPFERILQHSMVLTGELLSLFVSDAQAVVTTEHESLMLRHVSGVSLTFDHSGLAGEEPEFQFWVNEADDLPSFILSAAMWTGFDNIMVLYADYLDETETNESWVVEAAGDMSWSGGGMFFDRSHRILSIGSKAPGLTQDFYISNAKPGLRFHDEADTSEVEWELSAGDFRFWGRADDSGAPWAIPFRINVNAPTNSLTVLSDGTVTTGKTVHIGADTPTGHSLMITSTVPANPPEIDLNYPGNSGVEIEMSDSRLRFNLDSDGDDSPDEYDVLNINKFAPANTLSISAAGNIGNGIFFPLAPIHVQRANGTAQILVEETNGTAAERTLFQLKNNGMTKLGISNTESGIDWVLANSDTGLQFSRVGSAGVEMEILNNGNLVIAGGMTVQSDVNSKTEITEIDIANVLSLVAKLPVTRWEYKDAPGEAHIGPMAQDFYAAFGLGNTDKGISTIDTAGVALAAIQALNQKLVEQNLSLEQRVIELEQQNQRIEELVTRLVAEQADQVAMN